MSIDELERRTIAALRNNKFIEFLPLEDSIKNPNEKIILELFKTPYPIFYDENGIYYKNTAGEGEKIYCPEIIVGVTPEGEWLSNVLPLPGFDLDQSGNVRKADEAEALYIAMQISQFYKDGVFSDELKLVAKHYNFEDMIPLPGY